MKNDKFYLKNNFYNLFFIFNYCYNYFFVVDNFITVGY